MNVVMMRGNPNIVFHNFQGWRSENWRNMCVSQKPEKTCRLSLYIYIFPTLFSGASLFTSAPVNSTLFCIHPRYFLVLFHLLILFPPPGPSPLEPPRPTPSKGAVRGWGRGEGWLPLYRCRFSVFIFCPG